MGKYNIGDFAYGGKYHDYCWNPSYNPNATIENGLANCTTMSIAFSFILHMPYPVTRIVSAGNWHKVLTNGYEYKPYGTCQIKVGDILEWPDHVATVIEIKEGEALLGCSWYTGEHGQSIYDGKYDTRPFSSLKQLSDFMVENYPYRFYHESLLYKESQEVGGMPLYVLVAPKSVDPVERDEYRNQIEVLTNEQNIRDNDNKIVGVAKKGFYNVYATKQNNGYVWYEVENNRYIAGVNGRVVYLPARDDIEELKKENAELKQALKQINEIIKRWL